MGAAPDAILTSQSPEGAYPSTLHRNSRTVTDWNGFATAHVLRARRRAHASAATYTAAQQQALDYLQRCEAPDRPGAFGFWPHDSRPAWLTRLPEDADDTAIYTLELALHGRMPRSAVRGIIANVLLRHTLRSIEAPAPPWLRPGVFLTWLRQGRQNVVDCCANANVAALMAHAGLGHLPECVAACAMIEDGIRWAGTSAFRARTLTPFYPHGAELLDAIENAVELGATRLTIALRLIEQCAWAQSDGSHGICSSAYGRDTWTSLAVQSARQLRQQAREPAGVLAC